jgi:hypothetical protein
MRALKPSQLLTSIFLAALLAPALALAQSSPAPGADGSAGAKGGGMRDPEKMRAAFAERFKKADANGDGKLTKAEAEAGMPMVARNFGAIDTNKDGFVTPDEIRAGMEQRRQAKGGGGDAPPK